MPNTAVCTKRVSTPCNSAASRFCAAARMARPRSVRVRMRNRPATTITVSAKETRSGTESVMAAMRTVCVEYEV